MEKSYPIAVEVAADFAMFANPATGGDALSYPAIPYSTVKGILESIAFMPTAQIIPLRLHVCRPIQYAKFDYNCVHSHLRKPDLITKEAALQRREIMLVDVVYQIFAEIVEVNCPVISERAAKYKDRNQAHALQCIFMRRVHDGTPYRNIYLGRTEYVPTYLGPCRKSSKPDPSVNLVIPQFLWHPFSEDQSGISSVWKPRFKQNVAIASGVLLYA